MRKLRFYPRMALVNLARNGQFYWPYLLTVAGTAAAYYIAAALAGTPDLPGATRYAYLSMFMTIGAIVVAVFSAVFLTYTNRFLMKRRKKELGLYNVLGLGKRHIAVVLGFETLYTALIGIVGGILLGLLLQKLATLLLWRIMRFDVQFGFYVSWPAIWGTAALFGLILLGNLLGNLRQIHTQSPTELLRESSAGEREPKARRPLTVLGVLTLGGGYFIALLTQSATAALTLYFVAVFLVMIGTYCLFTSVSIAVLKALRSNKRFYYKTSRFIGISGMLYRMKRNAVGLANICILSTMVLVMVSGTLALFLGSGEALDQQFEGDLRVEVGYRPEARDPYDPAALSRGLEEQMDAGGAVYTAGISYRSLSFCAHEKNGVLRVQKNMDDSSVLICAMAAADYAALTGAETPALKPGQALAYTNGAGAERSAAFSFPGGTLRLNVLAPAADFPAPPQFCPSAVDTWYLVVHEDTLSALYHGQAAVLAADGEQMLWRGFWNVETGLDDELLAELDHYAGHEAVMGEWSRMRVVSRDSFAADYYSLNGGFFFLGIFLGTIFIMATVLIIYYKQLSEGYEDRERYLIMQKVGMEPKTVRRSINAQMRVVFFAPLAVATVHVAFDFGLMVRLLTLFALHNTALVLVCTAAALGVFVLLYALVYRATAKAYYKLVRA